ncbi:FAD binding domain-containing protein [Daldinia decipiens]|uniref:FAD binding domain-containing protein n=1 Tax=Daldinia decipiens TaxID=326647 RepID=UPI0020C3CEC7|nr:FAD binding domain-containing protein [Daldinia decipiens]KAI1655194.1 FAD binding domain-containing protein [Daldinia decipiens]
MLSRAIFNALAIFASTAAAGPTWHASRGEDLVKFLERATAPTLDFNISSSASIVTPDSPEWVDDTTRWSTWSAPTFSVAFLPAEEKDVSVGLQYMTKHNIQFLAGGGGHGNTVTLAKAKNVVFINMEKFNKITVNSDKTITVGGGAKFGDVYTVAYGAGRELPLGSCSCVGVGGASLGGGHGRLQGKYGLIVDAIVSMRVALWDGSIVEVSATKNSDLFWAMRGAGHNFGIVLSFTYKTWPLQNNGLTYNADMTFTNASLEGVFGVINELIPNQDPGLALDLFILTDSSTHETVTYLNIVYAGTKDQGDQFTARFATNKKSTDPIERTSLNVTMAPWSQITHVAAGGMIDLACLDGASQNVYTANLKQFDIPQQRQFYNSYVEFIKKNPLASNSIIFYEIFGQKAVTEQPAEQTAVGNRDYANILALYQTTYTDESVAPAADAWARSLRDEVIKPEHSGYDIESVYMNYAHGNEKLEAMYGYEPWRLERLRSLKRRYDPKGFFNFYNSVL